MPKRFLRFELYSIHAHLESGDVDYEKVFAAMPGLRGHHQQDGKRQVAIGTATFVDGRLFLIAYTGYSEKSLLFFDVQTKRELTESTTPGRFQAYKTHAMVDATKRLLLIESRRGSLSVDDLALLIEEQASATLPDYKNLELVFNPVADVEFMRRLDELIRIQAATVTIARPNVDWTERHHDLTQVADESQAKSLDVTARARRGRSLAKDAGLVEFVKQFAGTAMSMFKKIRIVGALTEESALITLDLGKHIEHATVLVEADPVTNFPSDDDVRKQMNEYLDSKQV